MIKVILQGHEERYPVEQLAMSLFGVAQDVQVESKLSIGARYVTASTKVTVKEKTTRASKRLAIDEETVRLRRQLLQQSLYLAALPHLEAVPAWGALAGVRPTKISTKALLAGKSERDVHKILEDVYFVTQPRRELAVDCSKSTVSAVEQMNEKDISLYVGIPFCPTRCAYCSFVSRSVGKRTELLEPYLQALEKEIIVTGKLLQESGRTVRTLYIGGGTPTTLSDSQMARLLEVIHQHIDLSRCIEFTVEGGRPDTLNAEKLRTIFAGGADRMSINPQSMVDSVLRASGRPHKAEDVLRSYQEAVDAGFENINMDLIAGLPGDTCEGFCHSLDVVAGLKPSNITVHTLALKKGADLFEKQVALPSAEDVTQMVDYANKTLRELGYKPYYLYRQKYMSGSFENVGWSRDNRDCLYNIYMMEELHTIISVGGGGMSKVNLPGGKLERFHNPKFPEQYIEQLDSVLKQKEELFRLL